MVDSRAKGAKAENDVKKVLIEYTDLNWLRVPASGALDASHGLKGDLYVAKVDNNYCVEVKHYKEDQLTSKLLTGKTPTIQEWWSQAVRQGIQVEKRPLLIYKFDRSKLFVATEDKPTVVKRYIFISSLNIYTMLLTDWLELEDMEFIK